MENYTVIKPLLLELHGALTPGKTLDMDPRQATFLVSGGWLERTQTPAKAKQTTRKKSPA